MGALAAGWGEPIRVITGPPPNDGEPVVLYGQRWLVERVVPTLGGRPWWHVDNGYVDPARGSLKRGTHRVTYRGLSPILMRDPDYSRATPLAPWREPGSFVLFAKPGPHYGRCLGIDTASWSQRTLALVSKHAKRPVIVRDKPPIGTDGTSGLKRALDRAFAVVTHSSNVAVDAIRAGVPVFCEPTCPAAPVACTDFTRIENPVRPDRARWWASLMSQQFTLNELADGTAYALLRRVRSQVDEA
jgi:hypothetical protein